VPEAHGKGSNPHGKNLCRVLHTEKGTRGTDIGKDGICRVQLIGNKAMALLCATADPRP